MTSRQRSESRRNAEHSLWIEAASTRERVEHPEWWYRLVSPDGARYGLSVADAIRAERAGAPFKSTRAHEWNNGEPEKEGS